MRHARTTFVDRLLSAMAAKGMGHNAMDRALGKAQGYTSNLIRRGSHPRADTLAKIADVLGVDVAYLVSGTAHSASPSRARPYSRDIVEYDDIYPNRAKVVAMALAEGVPEGAIAALLLERHAGGDLSMDEWIKNLRIYIRKTRTVRQALDDDGTFDD